MRAFSERLHVYCEKPLAAKELEVARICEASESSGRIFQADRSLSPDNRYRRLLTLKRWEEYLENQGRGISEICRVAFQEAINVNPDLVFMIMLPETSQPYGECWFYNAFIKGFSSEERPALVASEQCYASPYMPQLVNIPEAQWQENGLHVIMIPGICLSWVTPNTYARRSADYLKHSAGIFVYALDALPFENPALNAYKPLGQSRSNTFSFNDYKEALRN